MKVICTQENLKSGLQVVGRVISPSNSLPILNNILIKTEEGILKISSTNLELAITTNIRCKTEEEGEVTVLAKTIIDLVNNLPNKNISLEGKNGQMVVETENYHTNLKSLPAEEFPLIPQIEQKNQFNIDSQTLKTALGQVMFAVSTNQTQPEISGVLFSVQKNNLKIVATDRYRLAERKIVQKTEFEQDIIVPYKTIAEIVRVIGNQTGGIEVLINETQICFRLEQTQVISRLLDGQYPDYKQIIPENFTTTIRVNKNDLTNALKTGGVFSQGSNSVVFAYKRSTNLLTVTAESSELGKSVAELPSEIQGEDGVVVLNHRYILDCLSVVDTEKIIINIVNDSAPVIFLPEEEKDYLYLVMPIKS